MTAAVAPDNRPNPRVKDYKCQKLQKFQSNDQHGRAELQQISYKNLSNGVGILFYSENDVHGRQRYEGQVKNSLPGKVHKRKPKLLL